MCHRAAYWGVIVFASLSRADEPPGQVLDISAWKLTLPVTTRKADRPDEIEQPRLATFRDGEHFFVRPEKGVVFRAPSGGVPTKGSSYARCELRQMDAQGLDEVAWGTDDGAVHELAVRAAVIHLPKVKPHVVCAQIHDAKGDVLMVRLEDKKLLVERKPAADVVLSREYELGAPLDLVVRASEGRIRLWLDGNLKMDWTVARSGCYFKAGCYVQSNPSKGDAPDDYAEVVIERLYVR